MIPQRALLPQRHSHPHLHQPGSGFKLYTWRISLPSVRVPFLNVRGGHGCSPISQVRKRRPREGSGLPEGTRQRDGLEVPGLLKTQGLCSPQEGRGLCQVPGHEAPSFRGGLSWELVRPSAAICSPELFDYTMEIKPPLEIPAAFFPHWSNTKISHEE